MKRFFTFILFVSSFVFSNADVTPNLVLPIGHTDRINSIDFSPDGKLMATGSDDGYMKVWDVETGLLLKMVKGHGNYYPKVSDVKFFPDGNKVAYVSYDDTTKFKLIVFSVVNGENIWSSKYTESAILYSINTNGILNYYLDENKLNKINLDSHDSSTYMLKKPDFLFGDLLIYQAMIDIGNVIIKKAETVSNHVFEIIYLPLKYEKPIFNRYHSKVVSRIKNKDSVVIWDYYSCEISKILSVDSKTKKLALTFGYVEYLIRVNNKLVFENMILSNDGENLFMTSDNSILSYSVSTNNLDFEIKTESQIYFWFPISINNKSISIGLLDGKIEFYSFQSKKLQKVFKGKTVSVKRMGFVKYQNYPKGYILSVFSDTNILVWDIATGNVVMHPDIRLKHDVGIVISNNGAFPLVYDKDSSFLWDIVIDSIISQQKIYLDNNYVYRDPYVSKDGKNIYIKQINKPSIFNNEKKEFNHFDIDWKREVGSVSIHDSSVYIAMPNWSDRWYDNRNMIWVYKSSNLKRKVKKIKTSLGSYGEFSPQKDGLFAVVYGSKWENYTVSYPIIIYDTKNWKKKFELLGHTEDINHLSFSSDGKKLLSSSKDNTIHLWDIEEGKLVRVLKGAHTNAVTSAYFSQDNLHIVSTGEDHKTIVWDAETGKALYTRIQLENDNWLVYDEHYRYDGTEEARNLLYLTCGTEIIDLLQMKDALYVPGLVSLIMKGQPINYPKISDLHVCGVLPLVEILSENDSFYHFKINPRSSELQGVEVYINNKLVQTIPKEELLGTNEGYELVLQKDNLKLHFLSGMENKVTVVGITEEKGKQLRSRNLNVLSFGEPKVKAASPKLYALFVGVNEYKDPNISLNFPAKDASDLGHAVELSAKKFLGDTNVVVYYVYTNNGNKEIYNTPEKEGISKAIADIASKAKPEDIVMIFFAGHGVMQGNQEKYFTFLTAEASRENLIGISTQELQSWLSYDGPNKMLANKTILIFDACNSGQATKELIAFARNDDETRRVRQIEDLKDKSGMFILSASAPDQSAYEHPQYMQGLLTYSLLYTLKNNPEILEEGGYLNVQKWFLSAEKHLQHIIEHLGLKQQAQPMGTSNIRIGEVDDVVRNSIVLAEEKPIIMCANVTNDSMGYDYLELKGKLNRMLSIMSNDPSNSFVYLASENNSVNMLTISYEEKGDKVICKVTLIKRGKLLYKGKVEGHSSDIDALIIKIIEDASVYAQN